MDQNIKLTPLELTYQAHVSTKAQIIDSAKIRIKEIHKEIKSLTEEQYRLEDIINSIN